MPLDITIPTTKIETADGKPYTTYAITIRQPLRTLTLHRRYSDFVRLHADLTAQADAPPPRALPPKSWFSRTVNNAAMTERRRRDLEAYLQAIEHAADARWRHTPAWRNFLQLGTTARAANGDAESRAGSLVGIRDPATWLAVHQDLKANLHQARLALTRREQAQTAAQQHEAGAAAKKFLVLAGTLIAALDEGLKTLSGLGSNKGGGGVSGDAPVEKLGDGELRRRRDLLSGARKEKEVLEGVLGAMAVKSLAAGGSGAGASASVLSSGAATAGDKATLFRGGNANGSATSVGSGRRTLGAPAPETARTRELDNAGVLQLQRQIMREQDEDVAVMGSAVRRLRELGVQINDELQLQDEMLRMLDDDVDRVGSKIDVAKKRISKIR